MSNQNNQSAAESAKEWWKSLVEEERERLVKKYGHWSETETKQEEKDILFMWESEGWPDARE